MDTAVTTIGILYYRGDAGLLLQSFIWQTDDHPPEFPRINRFLDHWRREIEAVIKDIFLSYRLGHRTIPVNVKEIIFH